MVYPNLTAIVTAMLLQQASIDLVDSLEEDCWQWQDYGQLWCGRQAGPAMERNSAMWG